MSQLIHVLDSPGIFVPALKKDDINDIEIGLKLALCGCIKDSIIGILTVADYLLYVLNTFLSENPTASLSFTHVLVGDGID